jgi:hypothetical protein
LFLVQTILTFDLHLPESCFKSNQPSHFDPFPISFPRKTTDIVLKQSLMHAATQSLEKLLQSSCGHHMSESYRNLFKKAHVVMVCHCLFAWRKFFLLNGMSQQSLIIYSIAYVEGRLKHTEKKRAIHEAIYFHYVLFHVTIISSRFLLFPRISFLCSRGSEERRKDTC